MNLQIQSRYFDSILNKTVVTIINDKPYALLTAELEGDRLESENEILLKDSMEFLFKTYFVERAMPEAIQKVDKVSVEVEETKDLLNALQDAINNAETLISELNDKTQSIEQKQNKINEVFVLSDNLSDEQKSILLDQFKTWTVGETYGKDEVVNYNGVLYQVIKGITAQGHYLPDSVPSEYTPLRNTTTVIDGETVEVISDWVQPTGGHDAYKIGDKVRYNGKVYESKINGNDTTPATDERWWKEVV